MKTAEPLVDHDLVAVEQANAPAALPTSRPHADLGEEASERRSSVDPMAPTDRYRLVTPLFLLAKEL